MEDNVPTAELVDTYVEPRVSTVRTFGILSIVFALLIGASSLSNLAMGIFLVPFMDATVNQASEDAQLRQQELQAERLSNLEKQIELVESEEEKEMLRAQKEQISAAPQVPIPNVFSSMNHPKMLYFFITDGVTGAIMNTLMLVSGIGLLYRKEWARKLALWVAGLKIIRQIILQSVNIAVIIPIQLEGFKQMFEQMQQNAPGPGPGPVGMVGMQGIFMTAAAVFTLVVACIFPALTLWFLSRPGAKVVCSPGFEEYPSD